MTSVGSASAAACSTTGRTGGLRLARRMARSCAGRAPAQQRTCAAASASEAAAAAWGGTSAAASGRPEVVSMKASEAWAGASARVATRLARGAAAQRRRWHRACRCPSGAQRCCRWLLQGSACGRCRVGEAVRSAGLDMFARVRGCVGAGPGPGALASCLQGQGGQGAMRARGDGGCSSCWARRGHAGRPNQHCFPRLPPLPPLLSAGPHPTMADSPARSNSGASLRAEAPEFVATTEQARPGGPPRPTGRRWVAETPPGGAVGPARLEAHGCQLRAQQPPPAPPPPSQVPRRESGVRPIRTSSRQPRDAQLASLDASE